MKILVVEDNEGDYFLVHEYLLDTFPGVSITHNTLLSEANKSLNECQFDIILLDLSLPDSNGKDSIVDILELANGMPVIVLTGYGNVQFAMDSLKLGVQDYLVKDDVNAIVLQKSITYSIERSNISRTIQQNEKRFRALIENSTDGLTVIGADNKIQDISSAGKKILGYSQEQLVSSVREELIHHDDLAMFNNAYASILEKPDAICRIEYRFKLPDGAYIWLEGSFHNLLHEPSVNGIVEHYRDISDRKEAEESIRISEEKYRYLFDNNPDSIFIWSPNNYKILDVNQTASSLLGFSKAEYLNMQIGQLYHEQDLDELASLTENLMLNASRIEKRVVQNVSKSGESFYIDMALHKINYNGQDAVLAIGSDVSDKIQLEQSLEEERNKKSLEIAEAVITAQERERQEIGLELHDNVNQILAGSMMYLGLLRKELKTDSDLFNDIDKLITTAIQEIRKLSHSLIPPSLKELELGEALDHIINIAKKTDIFDIRRDLHEFNETLISEKLKLCIYRIVQEQFTNIFKHAKAKNILIRLYHENDKLVLRIKDDGIGFNPSVPPSGVGLINIQTRASLFNGTMEIVSSPGAGSELIVTFV